jgi:hypothetical protein
MQFPVGTVVVVCRVVVGGGGGGGAAWVVVVCAGGGGGGGGAAWVVVVCSDVVPGVGGTAVACALCAAGLAWWCRFLALCLGFGLAALVVVVAGVDWVVEVLVAAALWLEVDDEAPQALTTNTSSTAPSAMGRCLMGYLQGRHGPRVASRI